VLVGVNKYSQPSLTLHYARSDAERLGKALQDSRSGYYAKINVIELLDAQATRQAIIDRLRNAVAAAGAGDTIVFSFAGHGLQDAGKFYLAPAEYSAEDVRGTGLAWSEVAKVLDEAKARVVVFLDACHAGQSGRDGAVRNDDVVHDMLAASRAPLLVFAASKGRQVSFEDRKWGGGLFTYAVVNALTTKRSVFDRNGDGTIEISELYMATKGIVGRESNGQQTPWLVRRDLVGDFGLF
jgi:uncharacterized caspase-like protein